MNGQIYPRLALTNIRKNARNYVPYILTCIFAIAMYYMLHSLSMNKKIEETVFGGATMMYILEFGCHILAIFSFIFLFYTNSFLMKNRRKEFGLFNILGMEKRHIARVNFYESVFVAAVSLAGGLVVGIILDKLMYLLAARLMDAELSFGFYISLQSVQNTVIIFGVLFLLIFLNSVRLIHCSKPVELLKGGHTGEKEPRVKFPLAILGIACLGTGYYIAVTVKNPIKALTLFFVAVLLVIAGTYLLFSAVSIAFLKMLKNNKSYYYQTAHFISVSGMMYRMKQNAVGLANICILSTMVLVLVSSTTSLMTGVESIIKNRYPHQIELRLHTEEQGAIKRAENIAEQAAEKSNIRITKMTTYSNLQFACVYKGGNEFIVGSPTETGVGDIDNVHELNFITAEEYARYFKENITLSEDEVIFFKNGNLFSENSFTLFDKEYKIAGFTDKFLTDGMMLSDVTSTFGIVVKNMDVLKELEKKQKRVYGKNASSLISYCLLDTDASAADTVPLYKSIDRELRSFCGKNDIFYMGACRESQKMSVYGLYGGLFFIGIYLGLMFTVATVLIIYYKQISEGMDDKERFEIMQKVGMDENEVKKSIRSQVLTVFFMPLITAGVHAAFSLPIIRKILLMFSMNDRKLFITCNICCYLAFALIYSAVYVLTARMYYRLIRR